MSELSKEERELVDSFEAGEWRPVAEAQSEMARYQEIAAATFRKDRRINIRISSKDLDALQKRALREGIAYQALVASILHKYVSGQLTERGA